MIKIKILPQIIQIVIVQCVCIPAEVIFPGILLPTHMMGNFKYKMMT